MPITANLEKILDKAFENSTLADILSAPDGARDGAVHDRQTPPQRGPSGHSRYPAPTTVCTT